MPRKQTVIDLSPLTAGRVHLHGFECKLLRALRTLQGVTRMLPGQPTIEFWQVNNTNPEKVKCLDCWREHPEVAKTFTPYVVIKLRVNA